MNESALKRFWEWCGFKQLPVGKRDFHWERGKRVGNWVLPNQPNCYNMPYLPQPTLDNLFRFAVPVLHNPEGDINLTEIIIDPAMCDELIYYVYLRCDMLHDDGCIEREQFQASDTNLAQALYKAIQEVINE